MEFALPTMYGFGLVLFRTAGLFLTAPVLSSRSVAFQVRAGMTLAMAFIIFTGAGSPRVPLPEHFLFLGFQAVSETVMGAVAGLCARLIMDAAVAAGQTAGLSMGLGFGAFIDPNSGADSNTLGQLVSVLTVSCAVALGLHREAIAWLATSVRAIPPGSEIAWRSMGEHVFRYALMSMSISVRVAYPIMVAVTFGHLALAIAGRIAPSFNLSSIGFSVAILAGGGALFLVTPAAAHWLAQTAVDSFSRP